jgi:two-component system phosphate regulon sensor histidine kinase PhoR
LRFPPANLQLRRAQLVLMLAVLVPTILMTIIGIVLLILAERSMILFFGILVLTLCTSAITGYILVTIFVGKGASLARVQNDFVSSVSHELRTPLTAIRLLLDSLRDNRLEEGDRAQVLSLLGRETERLEQLVGRVLELSRLESGAHPYRREAVDVRDLVEEALAAFDAVTHTNPTKIQVRLEPSLVVTGDRQTLVRALINLLVNAWKYTGEDKRISIEAASDRRWVDIAIQDNGPGIGPEEQREIYEQFKRGRAAHETGAPGVGLGLAFVRAIVRGHRGKLQLQSRPGWTEFRIRLRRRLEPGQSPAPSAQQVA